MTKQIINIGQSANDKSGDPLRTAFTKVNDNFTELYNAIGADVQIPNQSNNGGKFLTTNGTTLSWSSISQEVGTGNTGFVDDKIYNLNGLELGNDDLVHGATARLSLPANGDGTEVSLLNYYGGVGIYSGFNPSVGQGWVFENNGTFTVPSVGTRSFTAICDGNHLITETPRPFDPDAWWSFAIAFVTNANGTVETQITNNTPWPSNPGYLTNDQFEFTEADHGIPGYTFTLTFTDIQNPGMFMYTTNLAASQPPSYRPTIASAGPIKINAGLKSLVLGTDGKLTLPAGGDIVDSTGVSVLTPSVIDGGNASTTF